MHVKLVDWVTRPIEGKSVDDVHCQADPKDPPLLQVLQVAGVTSVVAGSILLAYTLDHPYGDNAGSIRPRAMANTLAQLESTTGSARVPCDADGRPD